MSWNEKEVLVVTMTLRCLLSDEAAALYMTSDDESLNLKRVLSMYFVVFFRVCREAYEAGQHHRERSRFIWKWSITFYFNILFFWS